MSQEVVVPDVPGLGGYDNNNVGEEVLSRLAHQSTANYPTSVVRMDKEAILAATAAASAAALVVSSRRSSILECTPEVLKPGQAPTPKQYQQKKVVSKLVRFVHFVVYLSLENITFASL